MRSPLISGEDDRSCHFPDCCYLAAMRSPLISGEDMAPGPVMAKFGSPQ